MTFRTLPPSLEGEGRTPSRSGAQATAGGVG
jgi:hypothetical protein